MSGICQVHSILSVKDLPMAKLDGLGAVLDLLKGLQPKIAAQIAKKTLSLNLDPLPSDCKKLKGYSGYYRVDSGEYRIVYC